MFYSIGGWVLERIINLIFLGGWVDNGVLYGPYQALYGLPIVLVILIYDVWLTKINHSGIKQLSLLLLAIFFTYSSEAITGYGYQFLTGHHLRLCSTKYTIRCFIISCDSLLSSLY